MTKFSKKTGSGDRERSRRGDQRPRKSSSRENEGDKPKSYKAKRSFTKNKSFRENKAGERPRRSFGGSDERKPFKKESGERSSGYTDRPKRSDGEREEKRPYKKDFGKDKYSDKPRRAYKDSEERKPYKKDLADRAEKSARRYDGAEDVRPKKRSEDSEDRKSYKKVIKTDDKFSGFKKATGKHEDSRKSESGAGTAKRRFTKPRKNDETESSRRVKYDEFEEGRAFSKQEPRESFREKKGGKKPLPAAKTSPDGLIRLNKYLSNAGVASRREADNLILSGAVKVNGVVVDKLGSKVSPTDKITYGDSAVRTERKVYLLLNKPKDYITTVDDPKERKTVMELIAGACRERVYPVGRLDRNTTGLLLFTNDGELTTKLTHPKFGVKKVYHVSLNKGLKPEDFKAIIEGVELEDGIAMADDLAFVGEGKKEVGIEIHSGRNRIVRRLFEHLGYDVLKLDRVVFAGLTKKDLPRGKHRFLTAKEVSFLQMIG